MTSPCSNRLPHLEHCLIFNAKGNFTICSFAINIMFKFLAFCLNILCSIRNILEKFMLSENYDIFSEKSLNI